MSNVRFGKKCFAAEHLSTMYSVSFILLAVEVLCCVLTAEFENMRDALQQISPTQSVRSFAVCFHSGETVAVF